MNKEMESKIRETLENVKPWQRVPTSLEGVFLIKTYIFNGVFISFKHNYLEFL